MLYTEEIGIPKLREMARMPSPWLLIFMTLAARASSIAGRPNFTPRAFCLRLQTTETSRGRAFSVLFRLKGGGQVPKDRRRRLQTARINWIASWIRVP